MNKITGRVTGFLKENLADIAGIAGLLIVFLILAPIIVGHQGHPIIDCGRTAYVPSEILGGKVLYKDIGEIMAPFSAQFNALLYALFGENLNTLYGAGLVNSFIIIVTVFLISKNFTTKPVSWAIAFITTAVCVFNYYIFNFIFPYTHSMTYALSAFLLSVLFCVYYFKTSKSVFGLLSFFFIGLSLTTKYEYLIYFVLLSAAIFLFKPLSRKNTLISTGLFFLPPVVSFTALFLQGLSINDMLNTVDLIKRFSSSNTLHYLYTNFVGLYFNPEMFVVNITNLLNTAFNFLIIITMLYFLIGLIFNNFQSKIKFKLPFFVQIIAALGALKFFPWRLIAGISTEMSYTWLPLSTTAILIGFLAYFVKKGAVKNFLTDIKMLNQVQHDNKNVWNRFTVSLRTTVRKIGLKDAMFVFLTIVALTAVIKSYFFLHLRVYGPFMLPLVLIVNVVFLVEYLPSLLKFIDRDIWRKACFVILTGIGVFYALNDINAAMSFNNTPVKTNRGTLYTIKDYADPLNEAVAYINKNVPENASLLMLPEGVMLNFLTGRKSHDNYYTLLPTDIEIFGEEKIVNDLKNQPPDYIFINNRDSSDYGFAYFCKDYGFKTCKYIHQNYSYQTKFRSNSQHGLEIAVYKKN